MKANKIVKRKLDIPKNEAERTGETSDNKDLVESLSGNTLSEEDLEELCEDGRRYEEEKKIEAKELEKISDGIWKERREFELNRIRKSNQNKEKEIEK